MRIGQNPAKFVDHVVQPARITVAVVSYIPFLGGYYTESLDVLKTCLESIWQNTDLPYDLLVFDNASCQETRQYLEQSAQQGRIQYLVLSDKNIGKGGAWNFIFSAAPGEVIAYADSDIYFYPGWLSALMDVLEKFPKAGMVTGMPLWSPAEFSTSTVAWAQTEPGVEIQHGKFLPWQDYWRHSRSLGKEEKVARQQYDACQDICLLHQDKRYYIGAGHFQFIARRQVLGEALPIPSDRPMGQVRSLDITLNQKGYLRLSTPEWWIQHMGNTLQNLDSNLTTPTTPSQKNAPRQSSSGFWGWGVMRRLLFWLHNKSFEILYRKKEP